MHIFKLPLDLDFLLKSAQNLKSCSFLDNLRTIIQEGNTATRQMTPFFPSLFPYYLFVTFISEFENAQNLFLCGPTFVQFWSIKCFNFFVNSYRFRQFIIFQKKDNLRLYIFCIVHPPESNTHFFRLQLIDYSCVNFSSIFFYENIEDLV